MIAVPPFMVRTMMATNSIDVERSHVNLVYFSDTNFIFVYVGDYDDMTWTSFPSSASNVSERRRQAGTTPPRSPVVAPPSNSFTSSAIAIVRPTTLHAYANNQGDIMMGAETATRKRLAVDTSIGDDIDTEEAKRADPSFPEHSVSNANYPTPAESTSGPPLSAFSSAIWGVPPINNSSQASYLPDEDDTDDDL